MKNVPLIDLTLSKGLNKKISKAIGEVIESKSYILGSRVESFEKAFAKFLGVKYAVGVGSGTDALRLALRALGIGPGDKVLTVAFTSPFTAVAIVEEGSIPVFCDVDEKTYTIDLANAERKIDKRVKAIIPVHIYGNPCQIDHVLAIAKKHNLKIIEDACQAHGAKYKGKRVGIFGDLSAFSFYPTKNLGAFGDGGMIVTNSSSLAKKIYSLRHGGQTKRFWHVYKGVNSRLDEIQAAVLEIKLKDLNKNNRKREKLAQRYIKELSDLPVIFQQVTKNSNSVYHLFTIRTKKRTRLMNYLREGGIGCDIYYPYPTHLQPLFKNYEAGSLPTTESLDRELLAIPTSPTLSSEEQGKVILRIRNFFKK